MCAPQSIIGQSSPIMNNLSLKRRNHQRNGIFQLLNVYFVLTLCWCIGISVADDKSSCSAVQSIFEQRGIAKSEMPKTFTNDNALRYCDIPVTGTCCTYNMETRTAMRARTQLEKFTKDAIGKLSSILGTRAQKFNDFFKQLLAESKKEFHAMFKRTYGTIYEQNAYVFSDLFTELEFYYARGKVDLTEAMDSFFNRLYQKMFTVLNSQYSFDDKYLGCVSEHMKELKPFGDVPDKLSVQIKRSFVATRTYAQALSSAADIAKNMMNIRLTAECTAALTKMQGCAACSGFTEKPCHPFCVNVMKGCLQHYLDLDTEWDTFVGQMEKISERLLGPFNVVMVVEPINIKISEAIMNFQETGQDITNQVFQGCGKPVLGRRRRSINQFVTPSTNTDDFETVITNAKEIDSMRFKRAADPAKNNNNNKPNSRELVYEPMEFSNVDDYDSNKGRRKNGKNNGKKQSKNEDSNALKEPVLDRLVKDIRQKVKEFKKFWSNLPYQACNNDELMSAPPSNSANCWNGHTVDKYQHSIAADQEKNPEFTTTLTTRQSTIVSQQLFTLRTVISHLRNAYNGMDVEWSDQEEPYYGSGSGSGSGFDDDDESGSGLSPIELEPRVNHHHPGVQHTTQNSNTIHHDGGDHGGSDFTSRPPLHSPTHSSTSSGSSSSISSNSNSKDSSSFNNKISDNDEFAPSTTDSSSSRSGTSDNSISAGTTRVGEMSIRRALFIYLFPIYMKWVGDIFSPLL